jgi:hypothetical protein
MPINPKQLALLQTLYSQLQRKEIGLDGSRESRLAWAQQLLRKPVESFSKLSKGDMAHLIGCAQASLGIQPAAAAPSAGRQGIDDRRYGLDGRRDGQEYSSQPQLVSGEQIDRLRGLYERLGWDKARFEAFLASSSSPLRGRGAIRTVADARKVHYALKGMLQAQGLWEDRRTA